MAHRSPIETIVKSLTLNLELQAQYEIKDGKRNYTVKSITKPFIGQGETCDLAVIDLSKQLMDDLNGFPQN